MVSGKNKILIIEDDQTLVKLISSILDKSQYEVLMATESDEGLDKAKSEKPDLVVLDILLPGKSGFECLKKLKEMKETKAIPVIILSNLGQTEEIRRGLALGAVGYLVKADFQIDEILEEINNVLKIH